MFLEMKQGWWRIASEEEFDRLCNSLHCRGMREKHLQRVAMKHKKYCLQAIEQANAPGNSKLLKTCSFSSSCLYRVRGKI